MKQPKEGQYPKYFKYYIEKIKGGSMVSVLKERQAAVQNILGILTEEQGNYRYAEGKWTVKEVLHHTIDCERIMSYRALRISRGDATPLAGFDQDEYVYGANLKDVSLKDLLEEFDTVREATIWQAKNTSESALDNLGIASGKPVSALALMYIIMGHELHHTEVLEEKYLPNFK